MFRRWRGLGRRWLTSSAYINLLDRTKKILCTSVKEHNAGGEKLYKELTANVAGSGVAEGLDSCEGAVGGGGRVAVGGTESAVEWVWVCKLLGVLWVWVWMAAQSSHGEGLVDPGDFGEQIVGSSAVDVAVAAVAVAAATALKEDNDDDDENNDNDENNMTSPLLPKLSFEPLGKP